VKVSSQVSEQRVMQKIADLESQYRKIGISAVAAAMRYKDESKNPAYAPCEVVTPPEPAEAA